MKAWCFSLLLAACTSAGAESLRRALNVFPNWETITDMLQSLQERGITNVTEADLSRDISIWFTNMFIVHAALPVRIEDWPAPDVADTNRMTSILRFIEEHGWDMDRREHFMMPAVRGSEVGGLPWPQIAHLKYRATTRAGILYVLLNGFGPESAGVAWNPCTNRFDSMINGYKPLGSAWYSWKQTGRSTEPGDRVYEGEVEGNGQQDGAANRSQPIRAELNRTSVAAGSDR